MRKEKEKTKKVSVVTGATSKLGNALIKKLLEDGDEVRAVLRSAPSSTNMGRIPAGVIPHVSDLVFPSEKDKKELDTACKGADRVFHLAGAVYNYMYGIEKLMNINVVGTENLLNAIADTNKSKEVQILFASTVRVYGFGRKGEVLTENSAPKPKTAYAKSKYIAEQLIRSYAQANTNLKYTIFRIGTLYGEGYERPSFCKVFKLIKNGDMAFISNGENHLTLVNVYDVANAIVLAAKNKKCMNNTYNLTDGVAYTQKQLFSIIAKYMKVKPVSRSVHPLIAKIGGRALGINNDEFDFLASDRIVNIDKFKKETGFKPKARIEVEGVNMIKECES